MNRIIPGDLDERTILDYHKGDLAVVEVRSPDLDYTALGVVRSAGSSSLTLSNISARARRIGEIPEVVTTYQIGERPTTIYRLIQRGNTHRLSSRNLLEYQRGDPVIVKYRRDRPEARFTHVGYILDITPLLLITSNIDPNSEEIEGDIPEKKITLPLEDRILIAHLQPRID